MTITKQYIGETPAVLADHEFSPDDVVGLELVTADGTVTLSVADADGAEYIGQSPTLYPGTVIHFADGVKLAVSVTLVDLEPENPKPARPRRSTSKKETE